MSSLKFGTSGLRGLVEDLTGQPSQIYTRAFLRHIETLPGQAGREVLFGHDLRASSPAILRDCVAAARAAGFSPLVCGAVPTPALAEAALRLRAPAVMITGSHIPDDRNGLKFYRADGEITKADEEAIAANAVALSQEPALPAGESEGERLSILPTFKERTIAFFGDDALAGLTIGVYQHSSVARDLLVELLDGMGAVVVPFGRAERFVPVDTEAHRPEDVALIAAEAARQHLDAIVSTDGDADRPLVADETGAILRGDILGLLTARHLGLQTIVTPVTSSSAIEASGIASTVLRTKVGSPFVIAGMAEAERQGRPGIVGFEANGGTLLGSVVERDGRRLAALPTRDCVLPIVSVLCEVARSGMPLSRVVAGLNAGHTAAHRLQNIASEKSSAFLHRLAKDDAYRATLMAPAGQVAAVDDLDGVKMALADGRIIHYRASGNAPELRCYVEAGDAEAARELLEWGLDRAAREVA
ncbi:phosphomannomutase [Consotaella salsifontis]|uniref:Phosphomannomutase n=1 Tax=Consotaella salsifontis TaxID=1365950 RepID=A0A1T4LC68_9HYPH|nr:phosphomannomutase [Consotaella salsifontis]SJZ52392.1 phosphomannomutase [Consotaella salsifontis]